MKRSFSAKDECMVVSGFARYGPIFGSVSPARELAPREVRAKFGIEIACKAKGGEKRQKTKSRSARNEMCCAAAVLGLAQPRAASTSPAHYFYPQDCTALCECIGGGQHFPHWHCTWGWSRVCWHVNCMACILQFPRTHFDMKTNPGRRITFSCTLLSFHSQWIHYESLSVHSNTVSM